MSRSAPRPPRSSTRKTRLRLLRYRRDTPAVYAEPILICYALVNRPYIVDLQSDRSVVKQFLAQGYEVYLIDWGVPSAADRSMRLKDYVDGLMKNCVNVILKRHKTPSLHLVGYCMGGTMSTIFTARNPDLVKTLTIMAAPIDFHVGKDDSLVTFWSNPDYFDVDALVDAFGNVPGHVPAGQLPDDEAGAELLQQVHHLLRQDGRRQVHRELLRDGEVDQRQHPRRRRDLPRVRQEAVPAQRAGQGRVQAR